MYDLSPPVTKALQTLGTASSTLAERQAAFNALKVEVAKGKDAKQCAHNFVLFWNQMLLTDSLQSADLEIQDWALAAILEINGGTNRLNVLEGHYSIQNSKSALYRIMGDEISISSEKHEAFFAALGLIVQTRPEKIEAVVNAVTHLVRLPVLLSTVKTQAHFAPILFSIILLQRTAELPLPLQSAIGEWFRKTSIHIMELHGGIIALEETKLPEKCVPLLKLKSLRPHILSFFEDALQPWGQSDKGPLASRILQCQLFEVIADIFKDPEANLTQEEIAIFKKICRKYVAVIFRGNCNKNGYHWKLEDDFYEALHVMTEERQSIIFNLLAESGCRGMGSHLDVQYYTRSYFMEIKAARLLEVYQFNKALFLSVFFKRLEQGIDIRNDWVSWVERRGVDSMSDLVGCVYKDKHVPVNHMINSYYEYFCQLMLVPSYNQSACESKVAKLYKKFFNKKNLYDMLNFLESTGDETLSDFLTTKWFGDAESTPGAPQYILDLCMPKRIHAWSQDEKMMAMFVQSPVCLDRLFLLQEDLKLRAEMYQSGRDGKSPIQHIITNRPIWELVSPYIVEHLQVIQGFFKDFISVCRPLDLLDLFNLRSDAEFAMWERICLNPEHVEGISKFVDFFLKNETTIFAGLPLEQQSEYHKKWMEFVAHLVQYEGFSALLSNDMLKERILLSTRRLIPAGFNLWVQSQIKSDSSLDLVQKGQHLSYQSLEDERSYAGLALAELVYHGKVKIENEEVAKHLNKQFDLYSISCSQQLPRLAKLLYIFDQEPFKKRVENYQKMISDYLSRDGSVSLVNLENLSEECSDFADKDGAKLAMLIELRWVKSLGALFHCLIEDWLESEAESQGKSQNKKMKMSESESTDTAEERSGKLLIIFTNLSYALAKFARISSEYDPDFIELLPDLERLVQNLSSAAADDSSDIAEIQALIGLIFEALNTRHPRLKLQYHTLLETTGLSSQVKEFYALVRESAEAAAPEPERPLVVEKPAVAALRWDAGPPRVVPIPPPDSDPFASGGVLGLADDSRFAFLDSLWGDPDEVDVSAAFGVQGPERCVSPFFQAASEDLSATLGIRCESIQSNGDCQFLALAAQLIATYPDYQDLSSGVPMPPYFASEEAMLAYALRQKAVEYIRAHIDEFGEEGFSLYYLDKMSRSGEYGDECTLGALSKLLKLPIVVLSAEVLRNPASLRGHVITSDDANPVMNLDAALILFENSVPLHCYDSVKRPLSPKFTDWFNQHYYRRAAASPDEAGEEEFAFAPG